MKKNQLRSDVMRITNKVICQVDRNQPQNIDDDDDGKQNLDRLIQEMEKRDKERNTFEQATTLTDRFVIDVKARLQTRDTNYASSVVKFMTKYFMKKLNQL